MFKLSSFLVVFVLVGLCFGPSSEDGSSSGQGSSDTVAAENNGDHSSGGTSSSGSEDDKHETNPSEEDSKTKTDAVELTNIPGFVGDNKQKKELLNQFLKQCDMNGKTTSSGSSPSARNEVTQGSSTGSSHAVNEKLVSFQNCTFVCTPKKGSSKSEPFTLHMPEGTICNAKNNTCPANGPCPVPSLPSC
uniref:Putative ixodes 8-cys protein n=1 Tax=Ixodes ricinus TaxID=34613 RepID=A0A0K8RGH7_IXORI